MTRVDIFIPFKTAGTRWKDAEARRVDRLRSHGLELGIEHWRGETRTGKSADGTDWKCQLAHDYGFIKNTEGADGEEVDAFVGPWEIGHIFIIDQVINGKFDEHKVMLGFRDEDEARAGYLASYSPGWEGIGNITEVDADQLHDWLASGRTKEPFNWMEPYYEDEPVKMVDGCSCASCTPMTPEQRSAFIADALAKINKEA